jgi:hypothetical protein
MDSQSLSFNMEILQRKIGILILLLPITLLIVSTGYSNPPSSLSKVPGTDYLHNVTKVQQSQKILRALFLENNHQYSEARNIWKTLPQTSKSVKDHIFQSDLMDQKPGVLEAIPKTASSILIAVSYYKWQKKWHEAYQLLKKHPDIVDESEDLRLIKVTLALYLRNYEEAELLLLGMASQDIVDQTYLHVLWSWYYTLSGKKNGFRGAIKELEEDILYLPAPLVMIEYQRETWSDTKRRALKALTRFPSNRELIEEIVTVFQNHGAWNELGHLMNAKKYSRYATSTWIFTANVYLQTGQNTKLQQLLNTVPKTERQRLEYLDYLARIAVRRKEWDQLKQISDQYHKHYPYLRDGDLYLVEHRGETGSKQK